MNFLSLFNAAIQERFVLLA